MISENVGGPKMYKIDKIDNPILIDKRAHWWKYFYFG